MSGIVASRILIAWMAASALAARSAAAGAGRVDAAPSAGEQPVVTGSRSVSAPDVAASSPSAPDLVTGSRSVPAPPQVAPGVQPPRAAATVWYGWPGIIGELASRPLLFNDRTLAIAAGGYVLWPAFVHLRQDRPGAAVASLALRLGLPALAAYAAVGISGCQDDSGDFACLGESVFSWLLGAAAATVIDYAALSRTRADAATGPLRLEVMGGVLAGRGKRSMPAATLALETDSPSTPMTYSLQLAGALGDQIGPEGGSAHVQSVAARILAGWRVVDGERALLAMGPLLGVRQIRAERTYSEPAVGLVSQRIDSELAADLGAAVSLRARLGAGFSVGAGLLGYRVLVDNSEWSGGILPDWVVEAQAGVGWQPD